VHVNFIINRHAADALRLRFNYRDLNSKYHFDDFILHLASLSLSLSLSPSHVLILYTSRRLIDQLNFSIMISVIITSIKRIVKRS